MQKTKTNEYLDEGIK